MKSPTWVYHFTEAAKIVSGEEAKELYKQGWADSPARAEEYNPEPKAVEDMNVAELRDEATRLELTGFSNLNKADLIELIKG